MTRDFALLARAGVIELRAARRASELLDNPVGPPTARHRAPVPPARFSSRHTTAALLAFRGSIRTGSQEV